jgi:hypothetical protein
VPWCGPCGRFLSPSTVRVDGTCPECGGAVEAVRAHAGAENPRLPWHLKLLAAAAALYLGWRAWQGVDWLIARF